MNTTAILGHITRNPHFIQGNKDKSSVAFLTIANNDDKENTIFIEVSAFGKTAEYAHNNLKKGSKVIVEGKLAQRVKTTEKGLEYTETYLFCKRLTNLSNKKENQGS